MHLSSDELGIGYQDATRTACIAGLTPTTAFGLAQASGDGQGGGHGPSVIVRYHTPVARQGQPLPPLTRVTPMAVDNKLPWRGAGTQLVAESGRTSRFLL